MNINKHFLLNLFRIIPCLVIGLLSTVNLKAQCPTADIELNTQHEVDNFIIEYPNCKEFPYNLKVRHGSDVTNLDGLQNLEKVIGDLYIEWNPVLIDISGLNNLQSVGGTLWIYNNSSLASISDLTSLESTNWFLVWYNIALQNISGLEKLTKTGNFTINDNPLLTVVDGTSNLVTMQGALHIKNNPLLAQLPNFNKIEIITQSFTIEDSPLFSDFNTFTNLNYIGGDLFISNNSALQNLDGLSKVTRVNGDLLIQNNPQLSNISGLSNISQGTISGSSGLTIRDNPLVSVCNLPNICEYLATSKPRDISGNAGDCITEQAVIDACSQPNCPDGDLYFYSQDDLNQFAVDYPWCKHIEGSLSIWSVNISDLSPLSNIITIAGDLSISTTSLTSLNGLHNLTTVASIEISENELLVNIAALENIDPVTIQGLTITRNRDLSVCDLPNFCTYLSDISNPRSVYDNAGNCYSMLTLATACNIQAPECPTGGVFFSRQSEIDWFGINYPNCTHISGDLLFYDYSDEGNAFWDLTPLSNIQSIAGDLHVKYTSGLGSLDGLHNLTSIGGVIEIQGIRWLSDISALQHIDPTTIIGLLIEDNGELEICNLPNFCTYLTNDAATHPRSISGNAGDCISEQAVIDACNGTVSEGDDCSTAVSIQFLFGHPMGESQTSGTYSSEGMTSDGDPDFGDFCLRDDLVSMWFTFTGDGERYYIRSRYCGAFFYTDPNGSLYSGFCDDISPIRCHYDIDGSDENADANFHFYLNTEVGKTYYILVQAESTDDFITYNEFGSFCLEVTKLGEECIVHIPDPAFKAYLLENWEINTYDDDVIWCEEAERFFGTMDCSTLDISDLTGIEAFTNLSSLNCSDNHLTTLDLSENIYLSQLNCSDNNLNSLDLPDNEDMWYINCSNNRLGALDVSKITWLEVLDCSDNNLIKLDISDNWKVSELLCSNNFLNELNLANTNNGFLSTIHAHDNPNLTCIQVDDVEFSNTNWTGELFLFDPQHEFNEMCINCIHVDPSFTANFLLANAACGGDHIRMIDYTFLDVEMDQNAQFFWDFGDGTTSDERDPIHIYSLPGQYKVTLEVLVEECENPFMISKYIDIASCHRSESDNIQYANVFPNPSSGLFMLKANLPIKGDVFVRIMDMNGRELHTNKYTEMKNIYDDYLLREKGVFIVEIRHLLGVEYHQLIVVD